MTAAVAAGPAAGSGGVDLRLRGVVHLYASAEGDVVALRGVDLDVDAGQSVALLGPSGAGKSTVLGLLAGNFAASAGQVLVDEEDVGRMDGERLAQLRALDVSLIVQGFERNLLPYATVAENIWYAQQGARHRGRRDLPSPTELLDQFGLAAIATEPVASLGSGARQLAALVGGVAPQPRALLLDEPTSRLDPDSRDAVLDLVLAICRDLGTTVVMVTHDADVAARVGRTVTIRDGRVGSEGRRGVDYAVVGRDGLIQLPTDVFDVLPPESLVEVVRHPHSIELRPATDLP
jgi:putative ABC transport system ATP-binding protein